MHAHGTGANQHRAEARACATIAAQAQGALGSDLRDVPRDSEGPMSPSTPPDPTRRAVLAGGAALSLAATLPGRAAAAEPVLDDASGLNRTRVASHAVLRENTAERLVAHYRATLAEAQRSGRPVCAAGARHSMGGQSLVPNGHALTLEAGGIEVDPAAKTCRVVAGARWHHVIAALNQHGLSPRVMQSNNDFSVASTFCVNAHGWAVPHGPFGTSVRQVRLVLADGSLVTCSATENAELFRHALGGYGLFGLVVDLDLAVTDDLGLVADYQRMPARDLGHGFCARVDADPAIVMAFARLDVTRAHFLEEAQLTTYRRAPVQDGRHEMGDGHPGFVGVARAVYRAQQGSEAGRRFHWYAETHLSTGLGGRHPTRNRLLNTSSRLLENGDPDRTDILHEYFVPPERFADFLGITRLVLARSHADLLNVTVRLVEADPHSVLAYAPARRLALVMAFSQAKTPAGERDMRETTVAFIEQVLDLGGSYYLPYRLHAQRDQLARAYPGWEAFVTAKRRADPGGVFQNALWRTYA